MDSNEFRTLNEMYLKAVEKHSKPDCFLYKHGGQFQGVSSQDALRRTAALASVFARLGIKRHDRVGILSENRVEWALTDYALLGLGAVPVPIYTTLLEPDIEYILRDAGAKGVVVATEMQLRKVVNVRPRLPELSLVVAMDCSKLEGTGAECWEGSLALELAWPAGAVESFTAHALAARPEDVATILYTSGTMGQPKGVILTHSNIVSNIQACQQLFPLGRRDVAVSLLPLSHIFERMLDFLCLWVGTSIAYAESLDALPQNLRDVKPTLMGVVPRVLEKVHDRVMDVVRKAPAWRQKLFYWALEVGKRATFHQLEGLPLPRALRWQHALADKLVFSKVRQQLGGRISTLVSGAAPLARPLAEFFFAMGLPVYEGYGLTETSPVIAVNYPGHTKLGTVGPVIAGVEIQFGEESADPDGGSGREILVRGPSVSPGYFHLPAENHAAFVDGWFHTGDLGWIDKDGYLSITGRRKNLFKTSGGKYVSPEKLENLFQGSPYVHQIVVLGNARKFVGALVVPNLPRLESFARGQGLTFNTRAELVKHRQIVAFMQKVVDDANAGLPPHEKIRQIILLPEELSIAAGEVSPTLKIKRRVVEDKYRDRIEEMFARHAPPSEVAPEPDLRRSI